MNEDTSPAEKIVAQFTPGPWRHEYVDSLLVLADPPSGTRIIAGCWGHSDDLLAEGVANARLISAAPQMFEALKALSDGHAEPCWCPWRDRDVRHTFSCEKARAALDAAAPVPPSEVRP